MQRAEPILPGRQAKGHLHYFTRETARTTLSDSGNKILTALYAASVNVLRSKSLLSTLALLTRKVFINPHRDLEVPYWVAIPLW